MNFTKMIAVGTASLLVSLSLTSPISFHGCHRQTKVSCYPTCTVEDCTENGRHMHDGEYYCGYDHEGGYCDGTCYPVCTVEDCTEKGRHAHDGEYYCGYDHESGYCDGSCTVKSTRSTTYKRGHHGCH